MKKELPKMYQTKINKTVPSIQKVYSTLDNKADVTIITDTETIKRRVIARNRNNIITIDIVTKKIRAKEKK